MKDWKKPRCPSEVSCADIVEGVCQREGERIARREG